MSRCAGERVEVVSSNRAFALNCSFFRRPSSTPQCIFEFHLKIPVLLFKPERIDEIELGRALRWVDT